MDGGLSVVAKRSPAAAAAANGTDQGPGLALGQCNPKYNILAPQQIIAPRPSSMHSSYCVLSSVFAVRLFSHVLKLGIW